MGEGGRFHFHFILWQKHKNVKGEREEGLEAQYLRWLPHKNSALCTMSFPWEYYVCFFVCSGLLHLVQTFPKPSDYVLRLYIRSDRNAWAWGQMSAFFFFFSIWSHLRSRVQVWTTGDCFMAGWALDSHAWILTAFLRLQKSGFSCFTDNRVPQLDVVAVYPMNYCMWLMIQDF